MFSPLSVKYYEKLNPNLKTDEMTQYRSTSYNRSVELVDLNDGYEIVDWSKPIKVQGLKSFSYQIITSDKSKDGKFDGKDADGFIIKNNEINFKSNGELKVILYDLTGMQFL